MPRVVQPGGGGGKMRVRYTTRRKRGLVATAKRMMAEGKTLRAAADELRVSHANLSKWASQGMGEIDRVDKILRSKKKAALTGPSSQLKAIEDGLLRYIFEQREQGIEVKVFGVALTTSPPARLDVAKWVHNAMLEMKGEGKIIRNAWRRHDYEWFVDNDTREQDVVGTNNDDGAEGAI